MRLSRQHLLQQLFGLGFEGPEVLGDVLQRAEGWRKWLGRRNRGRPPTWEQFAGLLRVFPLIPAKIVHSVM